jgi:hypothetical protein
LKRLVPAAAVTAALAVTLAIYLLRLDRVVGLIVDDAWYVLLAKALATGHGYTLINSPTPGIVPFYPLGFPALLSIFYRLLPSFPENLWLLKSVSVAAMIAAGFVSFHYFARHRSLPVAVAFALAFATAIYPALVFLATSSVMSECVFTLAQLATIVLLERRRPAAAGACAAFAFLTRSFGVALLLGAVIYLWKEKLPRQAAVFAAVVAIAVGPWILYSRAHVPSAEQRVEQGGSIVLPYTEQFWDRVAGRPHTGRIGIGQLPERVWENLVEIGAADFGAFALYSLYRPIEPGETIRVSDPALVVSLFLACVALAGYIAAVREKLSLAEIVVPLAVGVSLLWGWEQYRILLPLVPFFFLYLLLGVRAIVRLVDRRRERVALLAVAWALVVSSLDGNYRYLQKKFDPVPRNRTQWIRAFDENETFMRYIGENVPKDALIATDNPALLHLYTGHRTIASTNPVARWRAWNRLGVRYYATISPYPLEPDPNESPYRTLHRSDGFMELRLLDLGPPESRPAWGTR